ncbi:phage virion morphogenesis protein [Leclercia sp. W6]|uniref:phage virion morphogenesis protein n=1 Tax=Leclercia sp. W6 TaxID=2282310 RepID=UPI000DF118D2|nr:phage virion morphogenesis protein [Leclercia sp. W6]AXF61192.1 phage virion morphogenesis protein [Leclercia sp. W6]
MENLKNIEFWLDDLLKQLSPPERRKLMRDVATELRKQQQNNIAMQKNPDGTAFEPRKSSGRAKQGRVRRKMFSKLRTNRYMKASATADSAEVKFDPRAVRIARVHHYGLRDRVSKYGPEVTYARRELMGITDVSEEMVRDIILTHLSR